MTIPKTLDLTAKPKRQEKGLLIHIPFRLLELHKELKPNGSIRVKMTYNFSTLDLTAKPKRLAKGLLIYILFRLLELH